MAVNGVVPTFFLNEQIINTESDICAYLLKFLFWNPGSTSNQIEHTLLSMRKLAATHAEDINTFPIQLGQMLTDTLQRYHAGWRCEVEVIDRNDEMKTYGLKIRMLDQNGVNLLSTDSLMIKDGYLTIRNEYEDTDTFNNSRSPRHIESTYSDINTQNAKAIYDKRAAERNAEQLREIKEREYQETKKTPTDKLKEAADTQTFLDELKSTTEEANKRNEALINANKDRPNHV